MKYSFCCRNHFFTVTGMILLAIALSSLDAAEEKRRPIFHFDSEDITEILPLIDDTTLVVWDLDETVMRCKSSLGTAAWFYSNVDRKMRQGSSWDEALADVSDINVALQKHIEFEPVDERTPALISQLQDRGLPVIAMTARIKPLIKDTLRQLDAIGVDFSRSKWLSESYSFGFHPSVRYEEGVLFVMDGYSKGSVLEQFYDQLNDREKITRIVFIDDKLRYILPVEEFARRRGLEFVGLRYSHEDTRRESFNITVADKQLEMLHALVRKSIVSGLRHSSSSLSITPLKSWCDGKSRQPPEGIHLCLLGCVIPDEVAVDLVENGATLVQ